jgi:flagellar hook-basal body complex protein FliE
MDAPYIPRLSPIGAFPKFQLDPMTITPSASGGVSGFASVLQQLAGGLNETTSKPDVMLEGLMRGDPTVDIHDVMIANSEAELAINTTTQSLTKLIQAYDRILQIQL